MSSAYEDMLRQAQAVRALSCIATWTHGQQGGGSDDGLPDDAQLEAMLASLMGNGAPGEVRL